MRFVIQEYQQRANDWEYEKRVLWEQIEAFDFHRNALTEKCEWLQVRLSKHNFSKLSIYLYIS
jgi:hypothetical protein